MISKIFFLQLVGWHKKREGNFLVCFEDLPLRQWLMKFVNGGRFWSRDRISQRTKPGEWQVTFYSMVSCLLFVNYHSIPISLTIRLFIDSNQNTIVANMNGTTYFWYSYWSSLCFTIDSEHTRTQSKRISFYWRKRPESNWMIIMKYDHVS